MNINLTAQCETCGEKTNCRIGLSNRFEQPLSFNCQDCGALIEITLGQDKCSFIGAVQVLDNTPFDNKTNFVDLHLDFPVSFEKYVMGKTPFIRAATRVDYKYLMYHSARLDRLNEIHNKAREFGLLIKLYRNEKLTPFKLSCKRNFGVTVVSDKPEDVNAALYLIISRTMEPFAYPGQNESSVVAFNDVITTLGQTEPEAMNAFMKEILGSGFLKNLQLDCLEIYPKILAAELPLRPALFLDFDDEYKENPVPMRVSTADFQSLRDTYKDMAEIISRQYVLVASINNLIERGDHNAFKPGIGKTSSKDSTPKNIHQFADIPFGKKLDYIDDTWLPPLEGGSDSKLRNAIAHFKTEYDEITQTISYYPRHEGIEQKRAETISFLQFMYQLLTTYREMHRLHHLIKCLFFFHFIVRRDSRA